jgi:hypothetical protein
VPFCWKNFHNTKCAPGVGKILSRWEKLLSRLEVRLASKFFPQFPFGIGKFAWQLNFGHHHQVTVASAVQRQAPSSDTQLLAGLRSSRDTDIHPAI